MRHPFLMFRLARDMKPRLPSEIQELFPDDVIRRILTFVPHLRKEKPFPTSPSLQRELERIQRSPLRGKNEMYLKEFDDFILK